MAAGCSIRCHAKDTNAALFIAIMGEKEERDKGRKRIKKEERGDG
jgi:hypothetical protein